MDINKIKKSGKTGLANALVEIASASSAAGWKGLRRRSLSKDLQTQTHRSRCAPRPLQGIAFPSQTGADQAPAQPMPLPSVVYGARRVSCVRQHLGPLAENMVIIVPEANRVRLRQVPAGRCRAPFPALRARPGRADRARLAGRDRRARSTRSG